MTKKHIALGALFACTSTAALAQSAAPPAASSPAAPANASQPAPTQIGAEIMSDLKKAGYTDVTVMPGSYIAQAKDKGGEPVTLFVGPGSVTEVVMGDAAPTRSAGTAHPASTDFTAVPAGDGLSSKLVGTDVYNKDNKDIGAIKDIAFTPHGVVKAYIVGVGGFLGMGDHYVAVRPSAMAITWNATDRKWHAMLDTNADSLKKAPEFKYPS